ncbi:MULTISPECIES: WcbI family polysaccharide biosynthesis putative acetyltransferase [Cryobacterium]|uniref:Peptide ABC transporter ATPase n=1 Tax=Cryobacterium breve TaxID=1259258 RepID=A0ABY2J1R5_9MICO|nr:MULTISPECIES: WcbI family polysaccharide biosynthesis putative acetyltransferase [Cryobacterium]TFC94115.1 peptide ABC transporter ATPase [Cryobacterium sp. TmT3-12]TFC98654.1 peptide ABC transporter ATPase [Cryobacterium breve]
MANQHADWRGVEPGSDRPLIVTHGNCQAESVRRAVAASDVATVRIPPAHELAADDLPHLNRLLARARFFISQPVRDDYRGLAIGTRQLAAQMPAHSTTVMFPVIRFAGLYPFHLIVRPPSDLGATPPLVAYHDARLLRTAFDRRFDPRSPVRRVDLTTEQVMTVGLRSIAELQQREQRHSTVLVSDLFTSPSFPQMRTINHPGNPVWLVVAARLRRALHLAEIPAMLDHPLLDSVHAPRLPIVADTYGLPDSPTDSWLVNGHRVSCGEVEDAHLRWYEDHPDAVDAGLARHADTLHGLGLR